MLIKLLTRLRLPCSGLKPHTLLLLRMTQNYKLSVLKVNISALLRVCMCVITQRQLTTISKCGQLAPTEYLQRHVRSAQYIHKMVGVWPPSRNGNKNSAKLCKNANAAVLWNFSEKTEIQANRRDVIVTKSWRVCWYMSQSRLTIPLSKQLKNQENTQILWLVECSKSKKKIKIK